MQLQTIWGWPIAVYLFLGGLGAGAFLTVALIALISGERFKSTVRFGAWTSVIVLSVGTLALLLEVGVPLRAIVLFQSFVNLSSWMAIGAWLLFAAILVDGAFALLWTDFALARLNRLWAPIVTRRVLWYTLLAVVGVPISLGVAVYTGILLGVLPFRPFWNTWLLPTLFTVSALDTGIGLVTAYATLRERGKGVQKLQKLLEISIALLILIEAVVLAYYLSTMLGTTGEGAVSAQLLVSGMLSPYFWVAIVGLGLVLPLLVCLSRLSGLARNPPMVVPLAAVSGCLVGGFTLRATVLAAGLPATLVSPGLLQMLSGVRFLP